jgi:hypothetical protein
MKRRADLKVTRTDKRGHPRQLIVMDDSERVDKKPIPLAEMAPAPIRVMVEPAFTSHDGAEERTSGMDRSKALVVRLIPFWSISLVLAAGMAWHFEWGAAWAIINWGCVCAGVYLLFDKRERADSRNGVERYRIDKAFELRKLELQHDHELKHMALETYLEVVERYYGLVEGDDAEH